MSPANHCAVCSADVGENARFCAACGSSLGDPSQAPTTFRSTSTVGRLASADSMNMGRFVPGAIVAGRYRIVGLLGRGGMGEIYRADDLKLGQPIALKFLPRGLADDPVRLERFHAEVRLSRQVSHPNVCRVYDIDEVDGQPFLAMEFVDGEDLASLLRRIGRLPGDKALQIARQVCAGLAAAHDRGVLHRDLKPANVMIDDRGHARIADFGLATLEREASGTGLSGTLAYMAPEQLQGMPASIRSDVYSLGLLLYEVHTGRNPFLGASLDELRVRKLDGVRAPSELTSDINPAVERVLLRCLEVDPAQRPASVRLVSAGLPGADPLAAAVAAGEIPSPELVAAIGQNESTSPAVAWGGFAAVALLVALVAGVFPHNHVALLANPEKSPAVLVERAESNLEELGYGEKPADRAFGFSADPEYFQYVERHNPGRERWDSIPADGFAFWYRGSPKPLAPSRVDGRLTAAEDDPPPLVSGMTFIRLDRHGRLARFDAVTPQLDASGPTGAVPDWSVPFRQAGLDMAAWKPVEPRWAPSFFVDSRAAWEGEHPDFPGQRVRIEAAGYHGRAASFRVVAPWAEANASATRPASFQDRINVWTTISLVIPLLIGGVVLARRNLKLARSDRRGAFRIGVFVFATQLAAWVIGTNHVASGSEIQMAFSAIAFSLMTAAFLWLWYLAAEPYVRRAWPQTMISWSRILAGRFHDPLVGRDLLLGCLAGSAVLALRGAGDAFSARMGIPPRMPFLGGLQLLEGPTGLISGLLDRFASAVNQGLVPLLILVLFRMLFRRTWAAVAAFMLTFGGIRLLSVNSGPVGVVIILLVTALSLILIVRFGVVALMAMGWTVYCLEAFPVTTDLSAWYAPAGLIGVALVAGLALFGAWTALGDRLYARVARPATG